MKSALIIVLSSIVIPLPLLLAQEARACSESEELVAGNSNFALQLLREVSDPDDTENFFFSPFSISAALGMTYAGADGITALEMERVLNFSSPQDSVSYAFRDLIGSMTSGDLAGAESGEPFTLAISNGLWAQEGFPFLESYVQQVTECYGAAVENLDFIDDPDGSREIINDWVAENTMNRILDLLPRGVITEDTRLVLTNAVYFKASWMHPFQEASTYRDTFHLHEAPPVEVPMMHQTKFFRNVVHSDYTAIELPYEGDEAAMLVVMPRDMQEFQRNLELETILNIRRNMSATNVFLSMPKFQFTHRISLSEVLKDMGMESAFQSDADFSGFTGRRDLYISAVVHKAFVKVDEAGTEAAAATAVVANITSMPAEPTSISIDRPFLFFIIHSETESVVFMGRMMDPSGG